MSPTARAWAWLVAFFAQVTAFKKGWYALAAGAATIVTQAVQAAAGVPWTWANTIATALAVLYFLATVFVENSTTDLGFTAADKAKVAGGIALLIAACQFAQPLVTLGRPITSSDLLAALLPLLGVAGIYGAKNREITTPVALPSGSSSDELPKDPGPSDQADTFYPDQNVEVAS